MQEGLTAAAEAALEEYAQLLLDAHIHIHIHGRVHIYIYIYVYIYIYIYMYIHRYAQVLLDAERSLDAESRTQSVLARRTASAHTELAALRVKCHSAQQEVLRLRTLVRHYEIRYPRAFASPMLEGHVAAAAAVAAVATLPAVAVEVVGEEVGKAVEVGKAEEVVAEEVLADRADRAPPGGGDGSAEPMIVNPDETEPPDATLPAVPLIVNPDEMRRLARLGLAVHPLLTNDKYAPPASGGTMADYEVRRLRELISFVISNELPANPSLEMLDLQQASELQYECLEASAPLGMHTHAYTCILIHTRKHTYTCTHMCTRYECFEASAAAAVYTADGDSLRTMETPLHMAAAGVVELGTLGSSAQSTTKSPQLGSSAQSTTESPHPADHGGGSALVEQMTFDDSTAEGGPTPHLLAPP